MLKVKLIEHTPNPEKLVAAAARLCYSQDDLDEIFSDLSDENTQKFLEMLISMGHESPIEHISFTFAISGVSRSLLAQITRHRIASFSVRSQRYVSEDNFEYITPPEIEADKEALEIFKASMDKSLQDYKKLSDILYKKHYEKYLSDGFSEKEASMKAEKKAIEDARYVLPNACETKMALTMNARSLLNFFKLRCCMRAQWEIRALAIEMLKEVKKVAPTIFKFAGPSCVHTGCREGKMSCGLAKEMKEFYNNL
ncbi:MAG: FAD-dependent thymidylate synthase [Clostridiaceae bacterium]|nr:FAD-dependent thymidylate synthase [Clostridiaceae bacterium]